MIPKVDLIHATTTKQNNGNSNSKKDNKNKSKKEQTFKEILKDSYEKGV